MHSCSSEGTSDATNQKAIGSRPCLGEGCPTVCMMHSCSSERTSDATNKKAQVGSRPCPGEGCPTGCPLIGCPAMLLPHPMLHTPVLYGGSPCPLRRMSRCRSTAVRRAPPSSCPYTPGNARFSGARTSRRATKYPASTLAYSMPPHVFNNATGSDDESFHSDTGLEFTTRRNSVDKGTFHPPPPLQVSHCCLKSPTLPL
jgi:hypothetical protein